MGSTDAVSRIARVWSSPSATTFASTATQSLQALLVLPLVVHRFDATTVAVWALFGTIAALQNVASLGFTPTFIRATAIANGGRADIGAVVDANAKPEAGPRWSVIGEIAAATRLLYGGIAIASALVVATVGTALVRHLIEATSDPSRIWIAWVCVIAGSCATTFVNAYTTIVEGLNHVALLRRWDTAFSLLGVATAASILLGGGDLLVLVVASQAFAVARLIRCYVIARQIDAPGVWTERHAGRRVLAALWPASWRSSIGTASMFGLQQASGVFYAQIGDPRLVAAYLLALRMLDALSAVARSPFYARIPLLIRLRASGQLDDHEREIRTGMRATYWLLLGGLVVAAITGPYVFSLLGSEVPFPPHTLWLAMGTAVMLERFGAMHLQVFTTTNRIVWHIAGAGYATIYLAAVALLHRPLGVYAFPLAMVCGHLGWYSWYSASRSYRVLATSFWAFERTMLLPPLLLAIASVIVAHVAT